MSVNLVIPIIYHIPSIQLSGIEKFELESKGEGKFFTHLLWNGRSVMIETYLKNKTLSEKKAENHIRENLKCIFAHLVNDPEWNPNDASIHLIWNEHGCQIALKTHNAKNVYVYKEYDVFLKDKFKTALKNTIKEKNKLELDQAMEYDAYGIKKLIELEQRILRIQMALMLSDKKPFQLC